MEELGLTSQRFSPRQINNSFSQNYYKLMWTNRVFSYAFQNLLTLANTFLTGYSKSPQNTMGDPSEKNTT